MRLKEKYQKEISPELKSKFSLSNDMLVPRLTKIVLNVGFGRNAKEKEYVATIGRTLTKISGQKVVFVAARKSVSAFKIREGQIIGAKVTLRGQRMYDFAERLVNVVFPRVRDFRGISDKSVDSTGNLSVGFKEYTCFPEISLEETDNIHGLEVCLSTSALTRERGLALFSLLGFPFKKDSK